MASARLLILSVLISIPFLLSSQSEFIPGWVIKKDSKIQGTLEISDWFKNPERIRFKGADGSIQEYLPTEISSFGSDDNKHYYISHDIDVDITQKQEFDLSKRSYKKGLAFLKVLKKGSIDLLVYTDKNNNYHFFYHTIDEKLVLLEFSETPAQQGSTKFIQKNYFFKKQLSTIFKSCVDIRNAISGANYTIKSLSNIFDKYYSCENMEYEYSDNYKPIIFTHGPKLGFGLSHTYFLDRAIPSMKITDYGLSFNPSLSYFLKIKQGDKFSSLAYRIAGGYSLHNVKGQETFEVQPNVGTPVYMDTHTVSVSFHMITASLGAEYYLPIGQKNVFLFGDFGVRKKIGDGKNEANRIRELNGDSSSKDDIAYSKIRSPIYSVGFGVGYQRGRFIYEFGIERDQGLSPFLGFPDRNKYFSLKLAYSW